MLQEKTLMMEEQLVWTIDGKRIMVYSLPEHFRNDRDAVRMAKEWKKQGVSNKDIISRLEVLREESLMNMIEDEEEAQRQTEEIREQEAEMDGTYAGGTLLNPYKEYDVRDEYFFKYSNQPDAIEYRRRKVWSE